MITTVPIARAGLRRLPLLTAAVATVTQGMAVVQAFVPAVVPISGVILCAWQNIHGAALVFGVVLALALTLALALALDCGHGRGRGRGRTEEIRFTAAKEQG